jgi:hypothetical protein
MGSRSTSSDLLDDVDDQRIAPRLAFGDRQAAGATAEGTPVRPPVAAGPTTSRSGRWIEAGKKST